MKSVPVTKTILMCLVLLSTSLSVSAQRDTKKKRDETARQREAATKKEQARRRAATAKQEQARRRAAAVKQEQARRRAAAIKQEQARLRAENTRRERARQLAEANRRREEAERRNRPVVVTNPPHSNGRPSWRTRRDNMRRHFSVTWGSNRRFRPITVNYVYSVTNNDYYYDSDYGYGTSSIESWMRVTASSLNIRKYASANSSISYVCGSIPMNDDVYVKAVVSPASSSLDWAMIPVSEVSQYINTSSCFDADYLYVAIDYLN